MNQSICFGSLAVETACPNRDQDFLFRHSETTRVIARPPTRANQPRHHGTTAYTPNVGRNIGSGATGSTLSHFFSSGPTPENPTSRCRTEPRFRHFPSGTTLPRDVPHCSA